MLIFKQLIIEEILQYLLKEYTPQIFFNTDETDQYYRVLPEHPLMFKAEANCGIKK